MRALADYLKPEVIQSLARLDLQARCIVEGYFAGLHKSPWHGFSIEFSEHRRYVPGDDPHGLDWRVWARTDRYYVKKFQAETTREALLVLDVSASMDYRSRAAGPTKYEYARCLAAALAYLLIRRRDAVGLALAGRRLECALAPRARSSHFRRLLAELARVRPRGPGALAPLVPQLERLMPHRGLIVLLGDFLEPLEPLRAALARLAHRGHELILFQVLDPAERRFSFTRPGVFVDAETGAELYVDPETAADAYQRRFDEAQAALARFARERRWDFVPLDTAVSFDRALTEFLLGRRRPRAG